MKIDKGVPLPKKRIPNGSYPFKEMAIGDSFMVTDGLASARVLAIHYGRRHGVKFTSRKEGDGLRVWRIE